MPSKMRSVETIRTELEQVRSLIRGDDTAANKEGLREREYYLQLELDRAEGRPLSVSWTHKGVL